MELPNGTYTKEQQLQILIDKLDAYVSHIHGGSVEMVSFKDNVVSVKLGGACLGCPLLPSTLHGWVAGTVKQFFPDVEVVEAE